MRNKISLIFQAKDIPDFTTVRKVTGSTVYTLRKKVEIYGEGDKNVVTEEGINYLFGENSIVGIRDDKRLAIDFNSLKELREFIDELDHREFVKELEG